MRLSTHHCIHKYPLTLNSIADGKFRADLVMPSHAEVRHVDMQSDQITVWAEIDREVVGTEERSFLIVGTGREFDACTWSRYVGTVRDNYYVWHIYEDR